MKPTDEAKRLREEIVLTISNSEPFTSEYFDDWGPDEIIEAINKLRP